MAAPTNYDQTNEWLAQVSQGAADLVAVLKGGVKVGQSGEFGDLSLIDTLSAAPVGNPATLRANLGFVAAALVEMQKYGIGNTGSNSFSDDVLTSATGIYAANSGKPEGYPNGAQYSSILKLKRSSDSRMIYIGSSGSPDGSNFRPRAWIESTYAATRYAAGAAELLSTAITTIDSNGFIKSASPIFRLANVAEYASGEGFTLDGCGAYNGEAKGVTASHDDVGVYTVTGSLGFATDGWTIEIPQDVNGNRLCFVETETAEDGTITVRTFGRRFDYETAMIVAGNPINIPDGRWIDLRLAMPKSDQP